MEAGGVPGRARRTPVRGATEARARSVAPPRGASAGRRARRAVAAALAAAAALGGCGLAEVGYPPIEAPQPARVIVYITPATSAVPATHPAPTSAPRPADSMLPEGTRIASLSPEQCLAELQQIGVPFRREPPTPGVVTPLRLTGPVGGVTYRGSGPPDSPFNVLDCRLARALVDLSAILRVHGVVEVEHYSMHRPKHRGKPSRSGGNTGHKGGLAIDAGVFRRRDGSTLRVLEDFHGHRGRPACGPEAATGATPEARALRDIVCRCAELGLFHVLLTPNYDRAHHNHFHMALKPDGVRWLLVR